MTATEPSIHNNQLPVTQRTKIKRLPQRGDYDRDLIYSILDEGLICHVGFTVDRQPFVIPTAYGRVGDRLYIHGSPASRMLRTLQKGIDVCVTVTLLDGLVLARSAFHHSMNYRSVVIFGTATVVSDVEEKTEALKAFTNHVVPERWEQVRPVMHQEVAGTLVLSLPIQEASAKVRSGPPNDDEADYALPIWAGVLPLRMVAQTPIDDPKLSSGLSVPDAICHYQRGQSPD
ncbi:MULTISPECIES: pyridoxamine 5'-phosphate oxidase family protein [unclassified Leptolyngbya]|uniref:pyridoxamine 5'-phosphate oxidase family protein n=1 Tax=unclassified Leptolyngbya TaxID=2650499 RepID=UPI00168845F6|nr:MULTISPECIES: pyridoxamine 5'-phosphate oxidase family protein [unclassified Leptolyngbya]MBD1910811.1 pyridoxamine 5'-phosphate oxidase family protein [Leptolyngbya sp. FACHB-8]MBD2157620.1 pyridoxamine 5'-phosphate oxidase family protein [Leptolyngbya sp. FACHB-16]